ncbi:MAG: ATP-binding protein [Prevotella sp.]|nr:ATP-binding protein [Prevotella sp.]
MLNRKIFDRLETWYQGDRAKAPLLDGARQVGKTTSIREFAHRHYKHFVEINFVKRKSAKKAFDGDLDTHTIIMNLSAMGYGPFVKGETLVFFDEIQDCPGARTSIKFLMEDHEYDFIESGSLLGINYKGGEDDEDGKENDEDVVASYPVGFEERINMYPLDFEEFLWAIGITQDVIDVLKECYVNRKAVPTLIHEQMMKYFRQYLVVGGMPEAVQKFVAEEDFQTVVKVQKSIIDSYRDDISKYAGKEKVLVKRVFDAIPSQLAKKDKRYILADLEKGASHRKYADPTQWLIDAGDAYYSFNTTEFKLPFSTTENRKLYKLFLVDTGLLTNMSLPKMQFQVMNGDIQINEGALTENFIAGELVKKGVSLHYYDRQSKQELDFIYKWDNGIAVLEVKSGEDFRDHNSLDAILRNSPDKVSRAMVFCRENLFVEGKITYYPLYMAMFL